MQRGEQFLVKGNFRHAKLHIENEAAYTLYFRVTRRLVVYLGVAVKSRYCGTAVL